MALLLFIDTSTKNCSVALAENGKELVSRIKLDTRSHAQILSVFIEELFEESGRAKKDLDAVVVAAGPGSYTGLRIGMSAAKGICYTLDIPLIALDSLENLARTMKDTVQDSNGVYIASLDSRKGEIYYAVMEGNGDILNPSQPAIVGELDWDKWLGRKVYISGNTEAKLQEANFKLEIERISIDYQVKNYFSEGFKSFISKTFDNLVYVEPKYLKPFQ